MCPKRDPTSTIWKKICVWDGTAHPLAQALADGEPEPGPAIAAARRRVHLTERLEQAVRRPAAGAGSRPREGRRAPGVSREPWEPAAGAHPRQVEDVVDEREEMIAAGSDGFGELPLLGRRNPSAPLPA